MMHVIAVITAKPGKRQEILDVLRDVVPHVLAEPGCIEYSVTTDAGVPGTMHSQTPFGPDRFATIEKWRSLEDLERHSELPFVAEYFEKVVDLMADRKVHFFTPVV